MRASRSSACAAASCRVCNEGRFRRAIANAPDDGFVTWGPRPNQLSKIPEGISVAGALWLAQLSLIGPAIALGAGIGWYQVLRTVGSYVASGVLLWYLGMVLIVTQDAVEVANVALWRYRRTLRPLATALYNERTRAAHPWFSRNAWTCPVAC